MDLEKLQICTAHFDYSHAHHHDIQQLNALLPEGYKYTVCECSINEGIYAVLRLNGTTEAIARTWIKEFQEHTKTTLRTQWKDKLTGQRSLFNMNLRCHHNTKPTSKTANSRLGSKNTDCPASMSVLVKQTNLKRKSKSNDIHITTLPMKVVLNFTHNHPIHSASALRHRDVSDEVKEVFTNLYKSLHSPFTALHAYKYDLHEEYGDEFAAISADRAKCPDLQWCYRLYYDIYKRTYREPDGETMMAHLQKMCDSYNTTDDKTAKMSQIDNKFCIALCTPLMKRVHSFVKESSELVFVDSSGGRDRHGCRVFLMMTHCAVEVLPLGVLITTSKSEKVLTSGFQLLKDLFPPEAFFGRQEKGPEVIMTEDAEAERKALGYIYQESTLLLSSCHVLQALLRYLWDARHKVQKEDRPYILKAVKEMLNAKNEVDLEHNYNELCRNEIIQKYVGLLKYLRRLYERRTEWGLCFRVHLPARGNNTNYCEAAVKVMKDKIFYSTKGFNVVQLVDFLFNRLENVYKQKLLDVANNRWKPSQISQYVSITNWDLPQCKIKQINSHAYEVPSQSNPDRTYYVDMEATMCSCSLGCNGGPCKHQHIVAKYFSTSSVNADPVTSSSLRKLFYKIAEGEDKDAWFQSLCSTGNLLQIGLEETKNQISVCQPMDSENLSNDPLMQHEDQPQVSNEDEEDETLYEMEKNINEISTLLKQKTNGNPKIFHEPLKIFLLNLKNCKSDASLISALTTFGKYSAAAISRTHRNGKIIGLQPTAVARCKTALRGRRCLESGRPVKRSLSSKENDYVKLQPIKKKIKAPHQLSVCVNTNIALDDMQNSYIDRGEELPPTFEKSENVNPDSHLAETSENSHENNYPRKLHVKEEIDYIVKEEHDISKEHSYAIVGEMLVKSVDIHEISCDIKEENIHYEVNDIVKEEHDIDYEEIY